MVDYRNLGTFFPENREILAESISAWHRLVTEMFDDPEGPNLDRCLGIVVAGSSAPVSSTERQ